MNSLACSKAAPWILVLGIATLTSCTGADDNADDSAEEALHQIAFQTTRDGNSEIYLMNPDGSGLINLTRHDSLDYHPAGSMDGSMVTFISSRGGSRQIWVMNRDGSQPRQVTPDGTASIDPSFSRDGSQIAFDARGEAGDEEIFVIPTGGGAATNISNHPATDSHPFWSPVSDEIAFYSNRANPASDSMDVYVMKSDGSDVRRLTDHEADDRFPSWSPDGSRIAFSSTMTGDAEIYTMNAADGSELIRLTYSAGDDLAPAWSPDGRAIAFVSGRHGPFEVYLVNVDGSGEQNLTNHERADSNPRWVSAAQ